MNQKPTTLLVQPRDPLVVRDARPFVADPGARALSLDWPLPQTVAGALRTFIGNQLDFAWDADGPDLARGIVHQGPLLAVRRVATEGAWKAFVPAPRDALVFAESNGRVAHPLRPAPLPYPEAGCDLPNGLLPLAIPDDRKPIGAAVWWSLADVGSWLASSAAVPIPLTDWLGGLPRDSRTHVGIDPRRGAHRPGVLYSTTGLTFGCAPLDEERPATAILARLSGAPAGWRATGALALGGEQRLSDIESAPSLWPEPPRHVIAALDGAMRLRLQLVTPAPFINGWRPGWLDSPADAQPEGTIPNTGIRVQLVGAAVGRRIPMSGWPLDRRRRPRGPRATRFAAPSGSVYFFEVRSGLLTAADVRALWLTSIADVDPDDLFTPNLDSQDRRDGYGLVVPGPW